MKYILFGIVLILMGNYCIDLSQAYVSATLELVALYLLMVGLVFAFIGLCDKSN